MGVKWIDIVEKEIEGSRDKQRKMLHNVLLVLEDSTLSMHVSVFFSADVKLSSFTIIKIMWFVLGTILLGMSRS